MVAGRLGLSPFFVATSGFATALRFPRECPRSLSPQWDSRHRRRPWFSLLLPGIPDVDQNLWDQNLWDQNLRDQNLRDQNPGRSAGTLDKVLLTRPDFSEQPGLVEQTALKQVQQRRRDLLRIQRRRIMAAIGTDLVEDALEQREIVGVED
jgi:hypothetical protein